MTCMKVEQTPIMQTDAKIFNQRRQEHMIRDILMNHIMNMMKTENKTGYKQQELPSMGAIFAMSDIYQAVEWREDDDLDNWSHQHVSKQMYIR